MTAKVTKTFVSKIVLHCPAGYRMEIDALVEQFLACGTQFDAVVGVDCERVESIIDELFVGEGTDPGRFILTSSHPGASIEEVIAFANSLSGEYVGDAQLIELA